MKHRTIVSGLAAMLLLTAGVVVAADQERDRERDQKQIKTQQTTGSQLMTDEERQEHRAKMQDAGSKEEREKIRAEHHEEMQERAREQGRTIPDKPRGGGMGGVVGGGRR